VKFTQIAPLYRSDVSSCSAARPRGRREHAAGGARERRVGISGDKALGVCARLGDRRYHVVVRRLRHVRQPARLPLCALRRASASVLHPLRLDGVGGATRRRSQPVKQ
jgi:hypothetical protein